MCIRDRSVDLNSIRVPPLKSIPKFKPLNVSNNKETITKDTIINLIFFQYL